MIQWSFTGTPTKFFIFIASFTLSRSRTAGRIIISGSIRVFSAGRSPRRSLYVIINILSKLIYYSSILIIRIGSRFGIISNYSQRKFKWQWCRIITHKLRSSGCVASSLLGYFFISSSLQWPTSNGCCSSCREGSILWIPLGVFAWVRCKCKC